MAQMLRRRTEHGFAATQIRHCADLLEIRPHGDEIDTFPSFRSEERRPGLEVARAHPAVQLCRPCELLCSDGPSSFLPGIPAVLGYERSCDLRAASSLGQP